MRVDGEQDWASAGIDCVLVEADLNTKPAEGRRARVNGGAMKQPPRSGTPGRCTASPRRGGGKSQPCRPGWCLGSSAGPPGRGGAPPARGSPATCGRAAPPGPLHLARRQSPSLAPRVGAPKCSPGASPCGTCASGVSRQPRPRHAFPRGPLRLNSARCGLLRGVSVVIRWKRVGNPHALPRLERARGSSRRGVHNRFARPQCSGRGWTGSWGSHASTSGEAGLA